MDEVLKSTLGLPKVLEELKSASPNWFNLGMELGIDHSDLTNLEEKYQSNDDRLREMLALRLKSGGSLTWMDLCASLKKPTVGRADVAEEIEHLHTPGQRKPKRKRKRQDEVDEGHIGNVAEACTTPKVQSQAATPEPSTTSVNEPGPSKRPQMSQDAPQPMESATAEKDSKCSHECETLQQCFAELVIFLQESPDIIADQMFSKKILKRKDLRGIIDMKSKGEKIRKLLLHVISQTELDPAVYKQFVQVLKEQDGLEEAVHQLEECYEAVTHNSEVPRTATQHKPVNQESRQQLRFSTADTTSKARQTVAWSDNHGTTAEGVTGDRHVLFIVSNYTDNADVVPRRPRYPLMNGERKKLEEQGVVRDCHSNDLTIMLNRYLLDRRTTVVGILAEEKAGDIKRHVKKLLQETDKAGVVLHYIGPGKDEEGDWCFSDGFITFEEIMDIYTEHFKDRVLTIISDCSYSGAWVTKAMRFMDDQRVGPCGHVAKEKGILVKVYASCQPTETPADLAFSTHCVSNNKQTGDIFFRGYLQTTFYEVHDNQHPSGLDYTLLRCGKKIEEECDMAPGSTWKKWSKGKRIYAVCTEDYSENVVWRYAEVEENKGKKAHIQKIARTRSTISGWPNTPVDYGDTQL